MKVMEIDVFSPKVKEKIYSDFSKDNEYITETAGFVPLDVKLRRFQETGQIMQFNTSEFTSADYRDMYLSEDLEITPEMDFEEIQEIQLKRQEFVKDLLEKKAKSQGINEKAGTDQPKQKEVKEEVIENKE